MSTATLETAYVGFTRACVAKGTAPIKVLGLLGVSAWIVFDALSDIVHVAATEPEASHIWVVPFVFAWLIFINRRRATQFSSGGRSFGALTTLIGVASWCAGYLYQIQSLWHLGAVVTVAGAFFYAAGSDYFWNLLPAWGSLLFIIPVPLRIQSAIAQPLERLAASATQSISEVFGLAVGRSGNQLSINGVDVCVVEACNGMRLVFALFLACYISMFLRPYKPWFRIAVLAAAPLIAVVANVIRLVPTLWVYGHYPPAAADRFHSFAGAIMVLLAFAALTASCRIAEWVGIPILSSQESAQNKFPLLAASRRVLPQGRANSQTRFPAGVPGVPLKRGGSESGSIQQSPLRQPSVFAAAAFTIAMCAGAARHLTLPKPSAAAGYHESVRSVAASIPLATGDWYCKDVPLPSASLQALKTNVAISRHCTNRVTGRSVDLLILQSPDIRDLFPHYPPVCYPGQGLILNNSTQVTLQLDRTNVIARRYSFHWHEFRRGEPTIVDNFMVLPTGRTQPDTAGMEQQIGSRYRYFGAAQVQVVYHEVLTPEEQTHCTESVLSAYLPLLQAIEGGPSL